MEGAQVAMAVDFSAAPAAVLVEHGAALKRSRHDDARFLGEVLKHCARFEPRHRGRAADRYTERALGLVDEGGES